MNVRTTLILAALAALLSLPSARAQEFLDTAGRWKSLTLPVKDPLARPQTIISHRGHVVIGCQARHVFVSRDSGETWTDVGEALPEGLTTVWTLAYPDTTSPLRILGIATTAAPQQAWMIESSDGGITWRNHQRLAELDALFAMRPLEIVALGMPVLSFVGSSSGGPPAGFIHSATGLLASSDGGTTWSRRASSFAIRAMEMSDERNGVASLIEFPLDTSSAAKSFGGISWTSDGGATWTRSYGFPDGGFFQFHMYKAFSKTEIRAFIPERYQNYLDWRLLSSSDGGRSWNDYRGIRARRPLFGPVFWRGTLDLHIICDGAIIQHSSDGGERFFLLRDTSSGWPVTNLDYLLYASAPISATDGRYIYLAAGTNVARWRMADMQPPYASADATADARTMDNGGLIITPNPVRHASQLTIASEVEGLREIVIVDALGRVRATIDAEGHSTVSLPRDLSTGRYTAIGRGSSRAYAVSFVVVKSE